MLKTLLAGALLASALSQDAFADDRLRIADEGTIGDRWMFAAGASAVAPGYPAAFLARQGDVCIALGYVIEPGGNTSNFVLLDQWSSLGDRKEPASGYWNAFAQAAAAAVSEWRFQPRPGQTAVPTLTVATIAFRGSQGSDLAVIRGKCEVGDLEEHIVRMDRPRTQLEKARLDNAYRILERWTSARMVRDVPSAMTKRAQ
jgi:hypothetical protein